MKLVGSNPKNKGGSDVSKITPIIGVNIIEIVIDIDTLNNYSKEPYSFQRYICDGTLGY